MKPNLLVLALYIAGSLCFLAGSVLSLWITTRGVR